MNKQTTIVAIAIIACMFFAAMPAAAEETEQQPAPSNDVSGLGHDVSAPHSNVKGGDDDRGRFKIPPGPRWPDPRP